MSSNASNVHPSENIEIEIDSEEEDILNRECVYCFASLLEGGCECIDEESESSSDYETDEESESDKGEDL